MYNVRMRFQLFECFQKIYFKVEKDFIVLFDSGPQTVIRGALALYECSKGSTDVT